MPLLKSYRSQRTDTVTEDTAREGLYWERDRQTRPMQRKSGWHAQDTAIERQQGPLQKGTRTPSTRSEGWNEERLRLGPKPSNKREIGDGPRKGKNQGERLELSQTRGRSEGHSKRTGSHRARRESSVRGRSQPRRIYGQAPETTCGREQG